jgi:hypothetical protein
MRRNPNMHYRRKTKKTKSSLVFCAYLVFNYTAARLKYISAGVLYGRTLPLFSFFWFFSYSGALTSIFLRLKTNKTVRNISYGLRGFNVFLFDNKAKLLLE